MHSDEDRCGEWSLDGPLPDTPPTPLRACELVPGHWITWPEMERAMRVLDTREYAIERLAEVEKDLARFGVEHSAEYEQLRQQHLVLRECIDFGVAHAQGEIEDSHPR